jgi:hypothetical protein
MTLVYARVDEKVQRSFAVITLSAVTFVEDDCDALKSRSPR